MRHALGLFGVENPHRDVAHLDPAPCGAYQHFDLELVAARRETHPLHPPHGVEPEPRLRVVEADARLHAEPEVREFVGEGVFARHVVRPQVAGPHEQCVGGLCDLFDEFRDVRGVVLSVRVDRQHVTVAVLRGVAQRPAQGVALAPVRSVGDAPDARPGDYPRRRVGRPVVHHQHVRAVAAHVSDDSGEGLFVVVGRDHRQYVVFFAGHSSSLTVPLSLSAVLPLLATVQTSFFAAGPSSASLMSISSSSSACGTTMPRNLHSRMAA